MSLTLHRSSQNWTQRGFIPPRPLPAVPDKNASIVNALRSARDWGCEMKCVNSNDVGITHPLATQEAGFARPGLSVSIGRRDASQALVSFLRKVELAVGKHYYEQDLLLDPSVNGVMPNIPLPTQEEEEAIAIALSPALRIGSTKPDPVVLRQPQKPKTVQERYEALRFDLPGRISAVTKPMRLDAQREHFSKHFGTAKTDVDFDDCGHPECLAAKQEIARWWECSDAWETLCSVFIKEMTAAEALIDEQSRFAKGTTVQKAASFGGEMIPVKNEIMDSDPADARERKCLWIIESTMENLRRFWPAGSTMSRTRCRHAIEEAAKARGYTKEFAESVARAEFFLARKPIMEAMSENGRSYVGAGAWNDLTDASAKYRKAIGIS